MTKQPDLAKEPIIGLGQLARVLGIGTGATRSAADRAGVEPTRLANRREFVSLDEATAIQRELNNR
jgi:hypothetical protein